MCNVVKAVEVEVEDNVATVTLEQGYGAAKIDLKAGKVIENAWENNDRVIDYGNGIFFETSEATVLLPYKEFPHVRLATA